MTNIFYVKYFSIFNSHLKMTSRRSKCRGFLFLVFIIKIIDSQEITYQHNDNKQIKETINFPDLDERLLLHEPH